MQDSTSTPRKNQKRKSVLRHAPALAESDLGWFCLYCGIALVPLKTPYTDARYYIQEGANSFLLRDEFALCSVDHIVPVCKGGADDIDNLALVCESCNWSKGGMDLSDYLHYNANRIMKRRKRRFFYHEG